MKCVPPKGHLATGVGSKGVLVAVVVVVNSSLLQRFLCCVAVKVLFVTCNYDGMAGKESCHVAISS